MENKLYNKEEFETLMKNTKEMNERLNSAFQRGKTFLDMLVDTQLWTGDSKDEFLCYFHLVMQYHGQLVGEAVPSIGKISSAKVKGKTCEIALNTLEELNRNMDEFTGNSRSYQELEKIR